MRTQHVFILWLVALGLVGCQAVGGIDDLTLATHGSGGSGSGIGGGSSSASSGSSGSAGGGGGAGGSGGAPIVGDIICGASICPIGAGSACCHDEYATNPGPADECVLGPPETDNCNTAAGTTGFEARIECQLPSHCPTGTICCGAHSTSGGKNWYPTVSCQKECSYPFYPACDPNAPMDTCPLVTDVNGTMFQLTCKQSLILPDGSFMCLP